MSFAEITGGATQLSSTANQTNIIASFDKTYPVGSFMVVIVAVDNNQTTDGDEGAVSSITDNATGGSNTWSKATEFTNGQGGAQSGACCSIWYSQLARQVTSSNAITVNFTNATSRDKSAVSIKGFSVGGGNTVAVEGTPGTLANDGADPGSLNVTTASIECLRVRGIAVETSTLTSLTPTSSWAIFPESTTSGGGSAGNMGVRGEWIISTGTGAASDPTLFSADCASVYVAFKEVAPVIPVHDGGFFPLL